MEDETVRESIVAYAVSKKMKSPTLCAHAHLTAVRPCGRRVAGLSPTPITSYRPWACHSLTVVCSASACKNSEKVSML